MTLTRLQWEKLLLRWCDMEITGEVRLICAVLADGIVMKDEDPWFFTGGGFDTYCRSIGLDAAFVEQQMAVAGEYDECGSV